METILAIDDEESIRKSYRLILGKDYSLALASNGTEALKILDVNAIDLILLDLTMPGMTGESFLRELSKRGNATPVIVVTASNTISAAVETMKLGAREFVTKPFEVDDLRMHVNRLLAEEREKRELLALREAAQNDFEAMIGISDAFREALGKARQAMQVDSAVLVTGESGTGKDLLARSIHNGGPRAGKAFVPISCCAIPEQLVESELFGHERGAFTGADERRVGKMKVADGGTLFLDEIGEMPLEAQAKLLRVLQDGSFFPVGSTKETRVDIRIICATNRRLEEAVSSGEFRHDLFYRVNVLRIEMPPLRARRDDIPELVAHFVAKHRSRVNAHVREFHPRAIARLQTYPWPGNIRELENTIERLLVYYGQETVIGVEHVEVLLPNHTQRNEAAATWNEFEGLPLDEATRKVESYLIRRALERSNFVQSRAAELLGTTRRILKYKMDQFNISTDYAEKARI